jgi:hypothetical protein
MQACIVDEPRKLEEIMQHLGSSAGRAGWVL